MKLMEMGLIGRKVRLTDSAPDHPGETGTVVKMALGRLQVEFQNGDVVWVSNKFIVGTQQTTESFVDGDLFPLEEMGAAKHCDKCGKTMSGHHYWYKGGWRCKKGAAGSEVAAQPPASQPTPELTRQDFEYLLKQNEDGDDVYWQVIDRDGEITVAYDLTFRRNTSFGAYQEYKSDITRANSTLEKLAARFKDNLVHVRTVTAETARSQDSRNEGNGDSAYSEYEQSLGGYVKLSKASKTTEPVAAPIASAPQPTPTSTEDTKARKGTPCSKCGMPIIGNHYWYKGERRCKMQKFDAPKPEQFSAPASHPPLETRDFKANDVNDQASFDRAQKFYAELERAAKKVK